MIEEGQKAPDFTLKDDGGNEVSLKDFKGKVVVLYFYPKDNTPGCTQEACDFKESKKSFSNSKAVVLGVSADSVESHGQFKEKFGLPFQLLSDPDKKMIQSYGVWQKKSFAGKEFMGIVRSTFIIGEDGTIKKIFPKVKVDGHIKEILENLN